MRLFGKEIGSKVEQKSWDGGSQMFTPTSSLYNGATRAQLYRSAYANIRLISQYIASSEVEFVRRSNQDQEVVNHWVKNLFMNPAQGDTIYDLLENTSISLLVNNNPFYYFIYDGATRPVAISVPIEGQIRPIVNAEGVSKYQISLGGKQRVLEPNEYLKFKSASPISGIEGMSPISSVEDYLNVEHLIQQFQLGFFNNNAVPSGIVTIEADRPTFENIKEQWIEQNRGAGNNNKIKFVRKDPASQSGLMSFDKFTQDNNSLDMKTLFDRIDQKVDEAFGVPREMKGFVQSSNLAGVKVAKSVFVENTVTPIIQKIQTKINSWLTTNFPNEDIQIKIHAKTDDDLDGNKLEADTLVSKANFVGQMVRAGFDPIETLQAAGLEPIKHLGLLPITLKTEDQIESEGEIVEQQDPTKGAGKQTLKKKISLKSVRIKALGTEDFNEEPDNLTKAIIKHTDAQYKKLDKEDPTVNLDDATKLAAVITPILFKMYNTAGANNIQQFAGLLGVSESDLVFPSNSPTKMALRAYTSRVTELFTATTKDDVEKIKAWAEQFSWDTKTIREELKSYYTAEGPYESQVGRTIANNITSRTKRTVVTETARVNNLASVEAAQTIQSEYGYTITKTWRRTGSEPEPICDSLEGTTIGVNKVFLRKGESLDLNNGDSFTNDWTSLHAGGAHPNCECIVEFDVTES